MATPKIIIYDIEVIPAICATFTLYPESIHHDNLLQDWSIVCVCWKELGKKTIYSSSVLDDPKRFKKNSADDYHVVKKVRDVFEDADILIGHNIRKFDTKKYNSRLISHGLPPLPSGILQLDTLSEIKKVAAFTSHRLDFLGKVLMGEGKIDTPKGLWIKALKGDKKAIQDMTNYCKGDVKLTEDLYLKILPYIRSHPHVGALAGDDRHETCPKCGSDELWQNKVRYTAAGVKKIQKQCAKCHGYATFTYKSV